MNNPNNDDYKATGTPKTIEQALQYADDEIEARGLRDADDKNTVRWGHIKDFLSQKAFDKDPVKAEHFREYFRKIFPETQSEMYKIMDAIIRGSK